MGLISVSKILITLVISYTTSATVYPGLTYLGGGSDASSRRIGSSFNEAHLQSTSAYYISQNRETWSGAIDFCREETDGKLLSLESPEENELVHELVRTHENLGTIWTAGIYNSNSPGSWFWATTGSEVKYTNWGFEEPRLTSKISRIAIRNDISSTRWFWTSSPSLSLHHYICEVEETPRPVKCFGRNDIVFVLNNSKYVGSSDFILGKEFVGLMSSAFAYPNRVSFIVYAKNVRIVVPLNSSMSLEAKQKLIINASWQQTLKASATYKGILAAVSELNTSNAGAGRKIVLLTSRTYHDHNKALMAAKLARDVGIKLYSVGVGNIGESGLDELGMIAGGVAENVFTTDNFESLNKFYNLLSVRLCAN